MLRLRYVLSFAVTPAFTMLAAANYLQPSPLCTVTGAYGFLSSMWFMCLAMAVAHAGPWLTLAGRSLSQRSAGPQYNREPDCCIGLPRTAQEVPAEY
jgi:hypothetical protein